MTRDLKTVSAAMLAWGLGEGLFYIFQPLYIQQFGADPILIGTILGVNGIVMVLAQIPAGFLADKWGARPLMRVFWVCGVAAAWTMALAPSLGWYVVGLLLYGVTSSVMAPLNTYVQGARGEWTVGRSISFVSAMYNIGGILGPLLGGLVGESLSLRFVYTLSGVVFTLSTAVVFFAQKQSVPVDLPNEQNTHLLRNRRFLRYLGLIVLVMFAVVLPQPLAANFLQNQRALSLNRIGQLGSLGGLGSVAMMLIFGHLPAGAALVIGQVGLALFSLLLWQGGSMVWYGLGYIFLGGFRLCRAMTVAMVRPVVREVEVGLAFGVVESLNSLAFVLAPPLAGLLVDRDPALVFPVSLIVLALAIGVSVWFIWQDRWRAAAPGMIDVEVQDES